MYYATEMDKAQNDADKYGETEERRVTPRVTDRSDYIRAIHSFLFHSPCVSQVVTANIVNISICVTIALLFGSVVVGGRESLVFTIQIRIPRQASISIIISYIPT